MTTEMNHSDEDAVVDVPEAFHVHDAATANWVVRKIIEARQYAERVEAWAAKERQRAKREEEFFMFRFGAQLEQWARAQIAVTRPRRNSVALPAATIGFRMQPLRLEIQDEPRLLEWCKQNAPAAVVTNERVLKTAIMTHFNATGECPAGTTVAGGAATFFIR